MLGANLASQLSPFYEIFATGGSSFKSHSNYKTWDLKSKNYNELIAWSKPDIIIHCGALTNGNTCNEEPIEAFDINGVSIKKLLDSTENHIKIIYISTDAVFSSETHNASEKDCVSPQNVYGKSKELGEFFLRTSDRDYTIIRTTIVGLNLNPAKSGFVEWIINSVKKGEEINLFDDVKFNPISVWDLGNEIKHIIDNKMDKSIYHISGSEISTKYEFGIKLIKALELKTSSVNKGSISDFTKRAKRANDQSLDCSLYQIETGRKLPTLNKTIESIIKNHTS